MTLDRPSTQERYGRALSSTHLEIEPERTGAVDFLIAAGWSQESLGTMLYRVMAEFDAIRGESLQSNAALRLAHRQAVELRHQLAREQSKADADLAECLALSALRDEILQVANRAARSDRLLLLNRLQSLRPAVIALAAYAIGQATRQRFMRPDDDVLALCAGVMDPWLDPICPACEGRGFNGGHLKPRVMCTACAGSRLRMVRLGFDARDREGHEFGRYLLARMDAKTEKVGRDIARFIRRWGKGTGDFDAAAHAALQERLEGLRSTQAQTD